MPQVRLYFRELFRDLRATIALDHVEMPVVLEKHLSDSQELLNALSRPRLKASRSSKRARCAGCLNEKAMVSVCHQASTDAVFSARIVAEYSGTARRLHEAVQEKKTTLAGAKQICNGLLTS